MSFKILLPYSSFQDFLRRIFRNFRRASFPTLSNFSNCKIPRFQKVITSRTYLYFIVQKENGGSPEQWFLGAMDTSTRSENHGNEGFSGSPKVESKKYQPKTKQNSSTEFLFATFLSKFSLKIASRPPEPKSGCFRRFSQNFYIIVYRKMEITRGVSLWSVVCSWKSAHHPHFEFSAP